MYAQWHKVPEAHLTRWAILFPATGLQWEYPAQSLIPLELQDWTSDDGNALTCNITSKLNLI